LGNIKKGWDIGWALGGWLERLGTKAKASKAKSTDLLQLFFKQLKMLLLG